MSSNLETHIPSENTNVTESSDTNDPQTVIRISVEKVLSKIEKEEGQRGKSITVPHSRRVAQIACQTMENNSFDIKIKLQEMELCALAHDIGKLFMDEKIIHSDRVITSETFKKEVLPHPKRGFYILLTDLLLKNQRLNIHDPFFQSLVNAIFFHHQKLDGSGYPRMLPEEHLYISTQIISVADAFDARCSRSYRKRIPFERAVEELRIELLADPSKYNPEIVEAVYETVVANQSLYSDF